MPVFLADVQADIDAFWTEVFAVNGMTYVAPGVVIFDGPVTTAGGVTEPLAVGPIYCTLDDTIHHDVPMMGQQIAPLGNLVVAFTAAHETGQHIEELLGIVKYQDAACTIGRFPWRPADGARAGIAADW